MNIGEINNFFGDLDIELLDQVLKGSFEDCESILEVGCGQGRNLIYFIREGFTVYGIDPDRSAIRLCQYIANGLGGADNCTFMTQKANGLSFADASMDAVISARVLHFANSEEEFREMWSEQQRVLRSGGLLFCSLDALTGVTIKAENLPEGKVKFPDNSVRFPLTTELLGVLDIDNHFNWLEPLKMINYDHQHSQAILVLQKK